MDPAPTEHYTLSLHDALPISERYFESGDAEAAREELQHGVQCAEAGLRLAHAAAHPYGEAILLGILGSLRGLAGEDRKSTRLNSSHVSISYAVFCLKKKKCSG